MPPPLPRRSPLLLLLLPFLLALAACAGPGVRAHLDDQGLISCFPAGSLDAEGNPASCETSAILRWRQRVLIATDKPPGVGATPVFSVPEGDGLHGQIGSDQLRYETADWVRDSRKIEEFAHDPALGLTLISTAFDRAPEPAHPDYARYNQLLTVFGDSIEHSKLVAPGEYRGIAYSSAIRNAITAALTDSAFPAGPPYFKVEGLAIVPPDTLYLGVREIGSHYASARQGLDLLRARFTITRGELQLDPAMHRIRLKPTQALGPSAGLSALLFDPERRGLWIAASIEGPEARPHQAHLLWLPLRGIERGRAQVVRDQHRQPFTLPFKLEGLSALDNGDLLGICDEDRTPSPVQIDGQTQHRGLHQGVFVRIGLR